MNDTGNAELTKRLDAIIYLLTAILPKPPRSQSLRDKIDTLSAAGLGPTDIGHILGRPPNIVTSELAKIKRRRAPTT
jgi:hypothetical protein